MDIIEHGWGKKIDTGHPVMMVMVVVVVEAKRTNERTAIR
jgi:hypothetical protein